MVEIRIVYEGQLRTRAGHGPSGCELVTDAPKDNQGQGQSFSPTDLVATALGTCMLTIMGIAARERGIMLEGTTVTVRKEMVADPLRRIARLPVTIDAPAAVPQDQRAALERAALTCPVTQSLHPRIETPVEFRWCLGLA